MWGQPPPAHPQPRVGQLPVPQGGGEKDFAEATWALNVESCFSIFFEPHAGQAGFCEPETSSSERAPQERQMYSNSGMARLFRGGERIDEHLGFHHEIRVDVDIPAPRLNNRPPHGRINTTERQACERKCDFEDIACGLTEEGAVTEASRCLRCDHFGYGIFRGGRDIKW